MYITYHCNKFKIMVLCRFHIEQQMLIIHIFSTNLHRITLLRFQVNLQKSRKYSDCQTLTVPVYFGFWYLYISDSLYSYYIESPDFLFFTVLQWLLVSTPWSDQVHSLQTYFSSCCGCTDLLGISVTGSMISFSRSFSTPLIRSIRISTARDAFCSTFWLIVVRRGTENSA